MSLFFLKSARQVYTEAISRGAEFQRNGRIHRCQVYTITLNGVTEEVYNKATDYIEKHALRLNYRPEVSTIDAEFPDDIDPAKKP